MQITMTKYLVPAVFALATAVAAPLASALEPVAVPAQTLSLTELEQRVSAEGIQIKEMKVRDLVLKVEGYDAQKREVEMLLDRRTGEVLSRRFDN